MKTSFRPRLLQSKILGRSVFHVFLCSEIRGKKVSFGFHTRKTGEIQATAEILANQWFRSSVFCVLGSGVECDVAAVYRELTYPI